MTDRSLATEVLARTESLAVIPAPPGAEAARAELVAAWWRADGWSRVTTDAMGNVWACVRDGDGGAVVLAAHLDTVFPEDLPHDVREESGRLLGPGVGDDSVAVAALSAVGTMVATSPGGPVWLLATVGEEGLGNLRGIIGALDDPVVPTAALVAVEGNYLGRVSAVGVGSIRWHVEVTAAGGHAWEAADAPSAVHAAAALIAGIRRLSADGARTAVNIGRIGGGEAINARARSCWFEVDIRADRPEALAELESRARAIVASVAIEGVGVQLADLGRRPAGSLDVSHPLRPGRRRCPRGGGHPAGVPGHEHRRERRTRPGIPAVAVGVTTGGGEHTPQEWIEIAPIADGLSVLAETVTRFEEAQG